MPDVEYNQHEYENDYDAGDCDSDYYIEGRLRRFVTINALLVMDITWVHHTCVVDATRVCPLVRYRIVMHLLDF